MNVFDFDGTILRGDSTLLFTLWCFRRFPAARRKIGRAVLRLPDLATKRISLTQWKEILYAYFACVPDMEAEVDRFWAKKLLRIKPWYLEMHRETDVVISASPFFLVNAACRRIGIRHVLCSQVNPATGRFTGTNCSGQEKVRRFQNAFPEGTIEQFYSDSHKDDPLARLARQAFWVKGDHLATWQFISSRAP